MAQIDWIATWQYIWGQIQAFFDLNFLQELIVVVIGLIWDIPITCGATFLGAGLAVLSAIGLRNWFDSRTEKKIKEKIIKHLATELILNKEVLKIWVSSEQRIVDTVMLAKLKNEAWEVFKDGGELVWIKDQAFLWVLSDVYASIKSIQRISERYLDITQTTHKSRSFTKEVLEELGEAIEHTTNMIGEVVMLMSDEYY